MDYSLHAVNPWEQDSSLMNCLRNGLILAEQMGFETLPGGGSECAKQIAELPSSSLIAVQKDISSKNKALYQVKRNVAAHSQEKETMDFIHLEIIEKSVNIVKELCSHFDSILKNTDSLINRLQKPFVGDHLKIQACYHEKAREVFTRIVPTLNDLSVFLDNITWMCNNDLSAAQLEPLIVTIQSLRASVETSYNSMCEMRRGVESLSNIEVNEVSVNDSLNVSNMVLKDLQQTPKSNSLNRSAESKRSFSRKPS